MQSKSLFWLLATALLTAASSAHARQPAKLRHIGYLTNTPLSNVSTNGDAFRQGLRDLHYIEGKNIVIEWRSGEESRERQRVIAAEFVRSKIDVIVAGGSGDIRAAKEATSTIPIVMVNGGDAVASGFVASLADLAVTSRAFRRFALSSWETVGVDERDHAQTRARRRPNDCFVPRPRAGIKRT